MAFGLDYMSGPSIDTMRASGVAFVCRYLSFENYLTRPKMLTEIEALALSNAGIAVVSNFEWYETRCAEGRAAGVVDAAIADKQARDRGMPATRPIYFSVDHDFSVGQIRAYFQGLVSVLGAPRVGVYGSYGICRDLRNEGLASWSWQTYAWSGGSWDSRNHIEQYQNGQRLGGADVDFNRAKTADFGQWFHVRSSHAGDTPGEDEMELSTVVPSASEYDNSGKMTFGRTVENMLTDVWRADHVINQDTLAAVKRIEDKVAALSAPTVDLDALAEALKPVIAKLAAAALADELSKRLES